MFLSSKNLIISALVTIAAIAVYVYNRSDTGGYVAPRSGNEEPLFSAEELRRYNGANDAGLFLAILGHVFDVSKGRQHYEPGATYHFFVGKDASKSFITGDFSQDSTEPDDVLDLSCTDLSGLQSWLDTYYKQYTYKGKLVGRHYDSLGHDTAYRRSLDERLRQCEELKLEEEQDKRQHPPCNVEWSAERGSRVWCTRNSGGISREWVGVPRQLFTPGQSAPRCVCVDPQADNSLALLKQYEHCVDTAAQCFVNT